MTGLPDELPSALGASCCHVLLDGNYLEGKRLENVFFFSPSPRFGSWLTELSKCHCGQRLLYHSTLSAAGEFIIVISVNGHIYSFIRNWCWVLYEIPSQTTKIFSTAFILLVLLRGIHLGYILKVFGSIKPENLALYLDGYRSMY